MNPLYFVHCDNRPSPTLVDRVLSDWQDGEICAPNSRFAVCLTHLMPTVLRKLRKP